MVARIGTLMIVSEKEERTESNTCQLLVCRIPQEYREMSS